MATFNSFWSSTLFSDVYLRKNFQPDLMGPKDLFDQFCLGLRQLWKELENENFDQWSRQETDEKWITPLTKLLAKGDQKFLLAIKKWNHLSDEEVGHEAREEILRSLENSDQAFAILTDGKLWQLYHREFSQTLERRYFEFDLGNLKNLLSIEYEFHQYARYFYYFFSPSLWGNHKNALYGHYNYGEDQKNFNKAFAFAYQVLKEKFGKKNEELVRTLIEGQLFTLIFIITCERKKILPVHTSDDDYDYKKTSLFEVVEYLEDGNIKDLNLNHQGHEIFQRMINVIEMIDQGRVGFEITGFKETIFTSEQWEILCAHPLNNHEMMEILFLLNFREKDEQVAYNLFSARELGTLYENFLEQQKRKQSGSYYTPDYVVKFTVEKTLLPLCGPLSSQEILALKICDPAMGSGHFILKACEYLVKEYRKKLRKEKGNKKIESYHESVTKVVSNCLYGVDVNEQTVKMAKLSLWISCAMKGIKLPNLDKQFLKGDGLFEEKNKILPHRFHCLLTNPPWGGVLNGFKDIIEKKYKEVCKQHKEIYKLFVKKCLDEIAEGGRIGLILPAGVLYQDRSRDARELILKQASLDYVGNLGDGVFGKDVSCPTAILVLAAQMTSTHSHYEYQDLTQQNEENKEKSLRERIGGRQKQMRSVLKDPLFSFTSFEQEIPYPCFELGEILSMRDAGINYQRVGPEVSSKGRGKEKEKGKSLAERIFYQGKRKSKKDIMYWKGEDLQLLMVREETERFLRHDYADYLKNNEVVRVNHLVYGLSPKLLWRQTASWPMVAMDDRGIAFGRSIQAGWINTSFKSQFNYEFLALYLNASFAQKLYCDLINEVGRIFPQIKLNYLKRLRVPKVPVDVLEESRKVYRKILTADFNLRKRMIDQYVEGIIASLEQEFSSDRGIASGEWRQR